jgi:hypothetical protein
MANWDRPSLSARTWILNGPTRTALIASTLFAAHTAIVGQFSRPEDGLRVWIGDALGLTGVEIGFDTAGTGGNVFMRMATFGTLAGAVASIAHGITTGQPGTMDVRLIGRELQLRLNGAETPILTYTLPTNSIILRMMHFGFVSNHTGCTVSNPTVYALEDVLRSRAEVLVGVCGGNTSICTDGASVKQIGTGNFNATGPVSLRDYQQKMYGVDGAHPVVIDVTAESVATWTLTDGVHMGGDASTTRATFLFTYNDRIGQGGDPQDPQNLLAFSVGLPLNADTGAERRGRAFYLSGQAGKVGSPCTGAMQAAGGSLNIGCVGSIWVLSGDPSLGNVSLLPRAEASVGLSSNEALAVGPEGRMIGHGAEGLFVMFESGAPIPLSAPWLTTVIQFPRSDLSKYLVQVRYDAARRYVHVFLTPRTAAADPTTPIRHFIYCVDQGNWESGGGGLFEMRWPDSLAPTCSTVWQGEVVWGTRTGLVCKFDDAANSDDDTAIDARAAMTLLAASTTRKEIILESMHLQSGIESGPIDVRVYGGVTAEDAYSKRAEELRWKETVASPGKLIRRGCRGPALVVELSQVSGTETFSVDAIDVVAKEGRHLTPAMRRPPAAPPAPCGPAVAVDGDTSGEGPGPGTGGGGETCTACADWMDINGEDGSYLMAGYQFLNTAQAQAQKAAGVILAANICDLAEDFNVSVMRDGWADPVIETLSAFLARTDPDAHKWDVKFRCDIQ